MAFFKFGKTVKHQRFNYIPRFYDPVKEEREERMKAARGITDNDPEAMKRRIMRNFREKHRGPVKLQQNAARRSNLILVVVLISLLFLTYILLTRYLPVIERWLE
jgi:hypothetical protein